MMHFALRQRPGQLRAMTANYATSVTVLPPVPDRTPRRRRKVSREVAEDAMFDGQMIIRNGRPYDPAWD